MPHADGIGFEYGFARRKCFAQNGIRETLTCINGIGRAANDLVLRGAEASSGFIDAIAFVLIFMSIIGLVLFFSLRFRLKTALVLMAGSAIIMGGLFVFAVS